MAAQAHAFHTDFARLLGDAGPIYQALEQANEKLLIDVTNLVGPLEQPLAPYLEEGMARPSRRPWPCLSDQWGGLADPYWAWEGMWSQVLCSPTSCRSTS